MSTKAKRYTQVKQVYEQVYDTYGAHIERTEVKRYTHAAEFLETAKAVSFSNTSRSQRAWSDSETGGSYDQHLIFMANGDARYVAKAEALLDKIARVANGVPEVAWESSPVGAYPIVPEYLAGHPMPMRCNQESETLAPISIYVATTCSGGITQEELMARGVAVLALVLKLQRIRSVNLYVTCETAGKRTSDDYIQVIPIHSKPLSIAHATYALTSAGFVRRLTYACAKEFSGSDYVHWSYNYHKLGGSDRSPAYESWIRKQLDMTPEDLYIFPSYLGDLSTTDPVAWVNSQLARYNVKE